MKIPRPGSADNGIMQSIGNGVKDNIQVYNIPKFDGHHHRSHPGILQDNIKEIEEFSRVCVMVNITSTVLG